VIVCRTLGPVEVTVDGEPAPPELLWRKHLALLVYLARSPRQTRSRDHLTALLWVDRNEAAARHSLSEALRVLRRHAGADMLEVSVGQVGLAPGAVELDVDRLEQLAAEEDWPAAAELVVGDFLEGFGVPDATAFEDWLAAEREHWRRRGVEVLLRSADALARSARAEAAAELAARALAIEPVSEPAFRTVIRCMALSGDRAGALELVERFEDRLAELDTEPGQETVAMIDRVRRERGMRRTSPIEGPDDNVILRPPLAGRTDELARLLDAATRSARSGRSMLLLLEGEPGVGKSRLLDEMLALLRLDGTPVTSARAVEGDLAVPSSGVLALARGGLLEAPGIATAPPSVLTAFAQALPEWADRFPGARGSAPAPVGRALLETVRAAAAEQPIVLAMDDAQWLDPDSALTLGVMLRDLRSAPLTLVLASSPYPERPELDELRSRIGRDLEGDAVRLRRLDRIALRSLAGEMLPWYDPVSLDRVVRRVATDSAGLPLLAVALLRAVALGLDLGTIAGTWPEPLRTLDQSLPGDLPDAVVAAIRVAFRRLTPDAQRVLISASVLGDLASPAVLARALEMEWDDLARALDELEWHRWLVAEPRGYSFAARIVRQIVQRDMVTPGQRRRVLEAAEGAPGGPAVRR